MQIREADTNPESNTEKGLTTLTQELLLSILLLCNIPDLLRLERVSAFHSSRLVRLPRILTVKCAPGLFRAPRCSENANPLARQPQSDGLHMRAHAHTDR